MTLRLSSSLGIVLLTLPLVAACSSNSARVRPLPPAPTGPVVTQPLPDTSAQPKQDPNAPPPVEAESGTEEPQVAALPQPQDKPTQEAVLGQWALASPGDSCQLFVTLTGWTGGYRASTRGCSSEVLKSISAWNLNGTQVVLAGTGGSPVATLAASGPTRFDGQTGQGTAVSFYR